MPVAGCHKSRGKYIVTEGKGYLRRERDRADVLGANRVNGFRSLVLREAKSGKGFRGISTYTEFNGNYATSPDVRIKYLEQELAYKNQEIEFLKKIVSLGAKERER